MRAAAEDEEQPNQHGAQARPEPRVVVSGALPLGEAVLEEMVVALAAGPAEDVGDGVEAGGTFVGFLDGGGDFALRGALVDVDAGLGGFGPGLVRGAVGDEAALDLVRVQLTRSLAVGLVEFVLVGAGLDTEEICREGVNVRSRGCGT